MKIIPVTIVFEQCKEEVNDETVLRNWKREGPLYRLPNGENIRVPHSGFTTEVDNKRFVFTLEGFGKLDRKPMMAMDDKTTAALQKFMGNSYNALNAAHKQEVVRCVREEGLDSFMKRLRANYAPGEGRIRALNLTIAKSEASEKAEQPAEGKSPMISDEKLREMGLL